MAETKIVKTLRFPNDGNDYNINAVALEGKTLNDLRTEFKIPDAALIFIGITSTSLTDGDTTNPITIEDKLVTVKVGNVVLQGTSNEDTVPDKEFVWDGTQWIELGDGASHALKSTTINAGDGLEGTLKLDGSSTFSHPKYSAQTVTGFIKDLQINAYGHVTSASRVETISTDDLQEGTETLYLYCGTSTTVM